MFSQPCSYSFKYAVRAWIQFEYHRQQNCWRNVSYRTLTGQRQFQNHAWSSSHREFIWGVPKRKTHYPNAAVSWSHKGRVLTSLIFLLTAEPLISNSLFRWKVFLQTIECLTSSFFRKLNDNLIQFLREKREADFHTVWVLQKLKLEFFEIHFESLCILSRHFDFGQSFSCC